LIDCQKSKEKRRAQAEGYAINDNNWHWWQTKSLEHAREVENYYLHEKPGRKMRGGTGGDLESSPVYVHILLES